MAPGGPAGPRSPRYSCPMQEAEDAAGIDPRLWPDGARRDDQGRLCLAGHPVTDLLTEFGSPLYVIDEVDFRRRARDFAAAFESWTVHYAGKAFLCKAVARWVAQEGLGLDVCSGNELAIALAAGFPPERIEFHGNNKSVAELAAAIEAGVGRIMVDCLEEIDRIEALAALADRPVTVSVRVTTGVEAHTHRYIATGGEDQKFGFSIRSGQAMAALLACRERPHLRLTGVHSHIGSQIFDTEAFGLAAGRVLELMARFRDQTGQELTHLNLGGGFGIAYTDQDRPLTPGELHQGLARKVEEGRAAWGLAPLHLAIEPGRAICGPAGVALYTVGLVKPVALGQGTSRRYVAVDGGMSDNIRPALYQAVYTAVLANRSSTAPLQAARVVGKHCESGDVLVQEAALPADLVAGDLVALPAAGAYTRSMASNYNQTARPAVVAVSPGEARLIIRRETLEDLLALDVG